MLTVHHLPELRQPAVLCAVSGWSDAGQAASGALGYLLTKWPNQRFAEFESDQIYNYTVTRPATTRPSGGRRKLTWPDFAWFGLPVPHAERDLVVLLGPEPDLRWQEMRRAALDLIERLNGSMLLTFGGFYAQVPHSGATRLFGRAYDETLVTKLRQMKLRDSDYQGPTGFLTALADGAEQRGLPTCGLWAAAPMYLQGTPNPKLAAALLMTAERLLGADLGTTELQAAGRDLELRLNQAMRDRPDFRKLVREMSPSVDEVESSEQSPEPAEPPGELPSSEEVLRDLETYLKDLRGEQES